MKNRPVLRHLGLAAISILLVASGCVSRGAYEENMGMLSEKLKTERTASASSIRSLEQKVQERGKTLSELTTRYMQLKTEKDSAQAKLDHLRDDMEALLKDMAELKLIIFTNLKGSEANEMMMKLNNMQKRVGRIIEKETAPEVPPEAESQPGTEALPGPATN